MFNKISLITIRSFGKKKFFLRFRDSDLKVHVVVLSVVPSVGIRKGR